MKTTCTRTLTCPFAKEHATMPLGLTDSDAPRRLVNVRLMRCFS